MFYVNAPKNGNNISSGGENLKDIFKEQIVKKDFSPRDFIMFSFFSLLVIIPSIIVAGFLTLTGGLGFSFLVLLVCGYLVFSIYSRFNIEYEYSLTNSELDIDVIYNKRKRKNVLNINLENIDYLANLSHLKNEQNSGENVQIKNFSKSKGTHLIFIKDTKIIFEPNEDFLNSIKKRLSFNKVIN